MKNNPLTRGIYLRGGVYWFAVQKKKKRHFVSLHTGDLSEAIRKAAAMRHGPELEPGDRLTPSTERFVAYMLALREKGAEGGWAKATNNKIYTLRRFVEFCGNTTPDRISTGLIRRFYEERLQTLNAQTAYGNLMTVRSFFNWCRDVEKSVRDNPCVPLRISAPPSVGRKDFCSAELVASLIQNCDREDLKFVLYCGFHAGLRFLEITEAVPWWFDLKAGLLHLRKTVTIQFKDREERTIPLTASFTKFVRDDYGLREPFMLHPENQHGKNRYRYDFTRPFREYMKAQGCQWVTPHTMRHTFASLLASLPPEKGGPSIFQIAVWLGDDVRTVQKHYAKLRPQPGAIDAAFEISAHSSSSEHQPPHPIHGDHKA